MKKIIILLLSLLMSACSAVKSAETLSSIQTEPTAETTVTETTAPEETTESIPKETEPVIETTKTETTAPSVDECPEQKPAPETTATTVEAPVEPIKTETTTEPSKTPAEAVEAEKPTEIPETVETPPESVTEPPKAEFDVNYWISFATTYALRIGLEIDPTAVDCWDNPTTANADCIYLERDLTHRLDRYKRDDDITAVNIWAESLGNGNYLIYIAYA